MFVKIHKSYRDVVAICDEDLIGKTFENEKARLELKESFYKDESLSHEETVKIMEYMKKEDATFNIAGEKSVKAALESGIVSEDGIKTVQNIPTVLVLL